MSCTPQNDSLGNSLVHARIQTESDITCSACSSSFKSHRSLDIHAKESTYVCKCTKTFARHDILDRHIYSFQPTTSYDCPDCKKSFLRLDHLRQHIYGCHKILREGQDQERYTCDRESCQGALFDSRGELTRHRREVHDKSPFPFNEEGCDRVKGRGYYLERALQKHQLKRHLDSHYARETWRFG